MPQLAVQQQQTRRELPMQTRFAAIQPATLNEAARTVELVWSTGAAVKRTDWWTGTRYIEQLSMDASAVDLGRLNSGAPLLNSHDGYELSGVIGVVERAWIENGEGRALVRFSERDDVVPIFADVKAGIIRNVSVGYNVRTYQKTERDGELPLWTAIDWEPMELSMVPIGADAGAGTRSQQQRTFPCTFVDEPTAAPAARKEDVMPEAKKPAGNESATEQQTTEATRSPAQTQQPSPDEIRAQAQAEERTRISDIREACRAARLPDTMADEFIAKGVSADAARKAILDQMAEQSKATEIRSHYDVHTVSDETVNFRAHVQEAMLHRLNPSGNQLTDGGRQYRGMTLLRIAEECLVRQHVNVRGFSRLEIATRAFQTNSDFANITANVLNKRLRQAYEENQPSYRRWARRAPNAPDFKNLSVIQLGGAPDLLKVNEAGEFKYGSMSDGNETYAVLTYGRIIPLARQLLINDDMRAFDRVPAAFGASAARLENRTVYAQLTANAALSDGVALFHANHGNLAGAGAISVTTLGAGRAAMRIQKGYQSEELNIVPAYLIVPAAIEQVAYQYTSTQYVPQQPSNINEFRAGGRTALEPIVEAVLDADSTSKWYLAAEASQVDTVEYCFLDGSDGVYMESEVGFDVDGMKVKARLDFAAKAIDYRGLYRNG